MFDRLSNRLQSVFRQLRGTGTLSEKNIQDALREVRMALLEADVHYATAKAFIELGLQRGRNQRHGQALREIAAQNDEGAVTASGFEGGEFHGENLGENRGASVCAGMRQPDRRAP